MYFVFQSLGDDARRSVVGQQDAAGSNWHEPLRVHFSRGEQKHLGQLV
jgi:hypothetical protein